LISLYFYKLSLPTFFKMATNYKIAFIFLTLFLFLYSSSAQSETIQQISPEGDTIVLEAIALAQIAANLEADYIKVQDIDKLYKNENLDIHDFDSIFKIQSATIEQNKNIFEEKKEYYSVREINNSLAEWNAFEKKATDWKELINDHLSVIDKDLYTLVTLNKVWELTQKEAKEQQAPPGVLKSISEILGTIKKANRELKDLQNNMLKRQNEISKVLLTINDVLSSLKKLEKELQSDYFSLDSPPIWQAADSTLSPKLLKEYLLKASDENIRGVKLFFESYQKTVYFHIFLFLIIWLSFFFLRKQSVILIDEENEFELQQAKKAISRHWLAALVISMILSIWLYPDLNSTISAILQLVYILIAIIFFPTYIDKKIRPILYAILALYFLDQLEVFFPVEMFFSRLVLFLKAFLAAWVLFKMLRSQDIVAKDLKRNKMGIVLFFMRLFLAFLIISILANIIGNLSLSVLLCNTVVIAIINLIIILLVVIMLNRTFIILLRTKFVRKSNYINNHWQRSEKRMTMTIFILALFLWLKGILNHLNLYDPLIEWITEIGQTSWKVGESSIEVGGIIDFFIVIVLTYVVYSFIKTLLDEELFPRVKLPRGVPGAISMIFGYVIVAYGIFLAIAAAGIDLSSFGLMAGALGVGIGFGLQNIVANFIAGLILAFERPIQVGDTIEAGTVMGDVKAIGVRATTIRTFDGSEVMVPNGNMIANDVINWTLSDRKKRRDIFVSVAYGSNPHEVLALLKKVGEGNPNVLQVPAPWALFEGFGDSALNFRLRIWTAMDVGMTTKSDVAMGIYDALAEAGIEIPFPQQDLHVKSFDPTVQEIIFPGRKKKENGNTENKGIRGNEELEDDD